MASKLPPIERPNHAAIVNMEPTDLLKVREYYILRLVEAHRRKDSDTIKAALDWLSALVGEMRIRGGDSSAKAETVLKVVA